MLVLGITAVLVSVAWSVFCYLYMRRKILHVRTQYREKLAVLASRFSRKIDNCRKYAYKAARDDISRAAQAAWSLNSVNLHRDIEDQIEE